MSDFWTDDKVEQLRALWRAGWTASECGRALGCSRDAAIGKAHRLGLPARKGPIQGKRVLNRERLEQCLRRNMSVWRMRRVFDCGDDTIKNNAAEIGWKVGRADRRVRAQHTPPPIGWKAGETCEWLTGDRPFTPCSAAREPGRPYCEFHSAKAFMPKPPKKEKAVFTFAPKGQWV